MTVNAKMLKNLELSPDLSIDREVIERGHFKHALKSFSANMSTAMLANVLLVLFCLPLVFIVIGLRPMLEAAATASMNFSGDLGYGFLGSANDYIQGALAVYKIRLIIAASCAPLIAIIGIGAAGACYCARNLVWGVKVKAFRHFGRGIKKYWWQYLLVFTIIGIEVSGLACSIIGMQYMSVTGAAPWWIYLLIVLISIIMFLTLLVLLLYIPMITHYGIKERAKLKNAVLMSFTNIISSTIVLILLGLPCLLMLSSFTSILFLMLMALGGFMFYLVAFNEYAMFTHDNFIQPLYENKLEQEERERRKQNSQGKKKKKKGGKR